jgi:hypothetical protein
MQTRGKGVVVLLTLLLVVMCYVVGYSDYRWGDVNSDGWCNIGDALMVACHLTGGGTYPLKCPDAGDLNGNGMIDIADLVALNSFLNGSNPTPPAAICDDPVDFCVDNCEKAFLWMGAPTYTATTASIPVYINATTSPVIGLNVTLEYDSAHVSSIAVTASTGSAQAWNRTAPCPSNRLAIINWESSTLCTGQSFAAETQLMTLTVNKTPGADAVIFNLCVSTEDTICGPARIYFGEASGYIASRCTQPSSPILVAGDANGDGVTTGTDVTYLVNYFRGAGPAPVARYGNCVALKW